MCLASNQVYCIARSPPKLPNQQRSSIMREDIATLTNYSDVQLTLFVTWTFGCRNSLKNQYHIWTHASLKGGQSAMVALWMDPKANAFRLQAG